MNGGGGRSSSSSRNTYNPSDRGRYRGAGGRSRSGRSQPHVGTVGRSENLSWVPKDTGMSRGKVLKHLDHSPSSDYSVQQECSLPGTEDLSAGVGKLDYSVQQECSLPGTEDLSAGVGKLELTRNPPEGLNQSSEQLGALHSSKMDFHSVSTPSDQSDKKPSLANSEGARGSYVSVAAYNVGIDCSSLVNTDCTLINSSPQADTGIKDGPSGKGKQSSETTNDKEGSVGRSENSDSVSPGVPYDICPKKPANLVRLKAPLLVNNREKRRITGRQVIRILRPGMVILKSYISSKDQVSIIKTCRELGISCGGFYRPGYRDGAQLHLNMMCLGMNWDPETGKYSKLRPIDGAKPPDLPNEFLQLVKTALQESHAHLQKESTIENAEKILPLMSPDICIVNFYERSGRLGLHQDKDESPESLGRGLPVVSFSIGDSADFLYGDDRDTEKAEKVILESGDVLIFGGKSRRIFHGVTAIHPDTAPKHLLEELDLRPGRLNLTFREF